MLGTNCQFLAQNDIFFTKISLDRTISILCSYNYKFLEYMNIYYIYKKQIIAKLNIFTISQLSAYNYYNSLNYYSFKNPYTLENNHNLHPLSSLQPSIPIYKILFHHKLFYPYYILRMYNNLRRRSPNR